MNVTETKSEGLSREFRVSIPKGELAAKLSAKIAEIQPKVSLKGFRPGKVPPEHIRKMYGKSLMGDVLNETVQETTAKALETKSLRPATQPSIDLVSDAGKVMDGESDLEFSMHVEVMPEFEPSEVSELVIERMVSEATDEQIDHQLGRVAENQRAYDTKDGAAVSGDAVVINFLGRIDGVAFEGGAADGQTLVLGEGRFIRGFEDQLIGAKAGDDIVVKVSFPDDYPVDTLKGKPAEFETKVTEVKSPRTPDIDDALATQLGMPDLAALRNAVKMRIESDLAALSRQQVKRVILDALDERHSFDLPAQMVKAEFQQIWAQLEQEKQADRLSDSDKSKSDDELKAEYEKIAQRRVRLGLVLAEIGRRAELVITNEELAAALRQEAQRYPGQEKAVIDFYRNNQNALAGLRAPIYEEKVIDYILGRAKVNDTKVSRDDLLKAVEEE